MLQFFLSLLTSLNFSLSLGNLGFHFEAGTAYQFSAQNDPQNPNPRGACIRRDVDDRKDHGVAHRTLPCRSKVLIVNRDNGRHTVATVVDRGPYGKTKGKFRGVIDMLPLVDRALKAKGTANVYVVSLSAR
jgi:hypothetical protein